MVNNLVIYSSVIKVQILTLHCTSVAKWIRQPCWLHVSPCFILRSSLIRERVGLWEHHAMCVSPTPPISTLEPLDLCRIWGFHSSGYEEFYLLGYNAAESVESHLTCSSWKSVDFEHTTQCYIPGGRTLQLIVFHETFYEHYTIGNRSSTVLFNSLQVVVMSCWTCKHPASCRCHCSRGWLNCPRVTVCV
jgi:hypothetical protein